MQPVAGAGSGVPSAPRAVIDPAQSPRSVTRTFSTSPRRGRMTRGRSMVSSGSGSVVGVASGSPRNASGTGTGAGAVSEPRSSDPQPFGVAAANTMSAGSGVDDEPAATRK